MVPFGEASEKKIKNEFDRKWKKDESDRIKHGEKKILTLLQTQNIAIQRTRKRISNWITR